MLDTGGKAVGKVQDESCSDFDRDENPRLALTHLIQAIGEAARRVSSQFQQAHPEVRRRKIIGMRHRVVHDYLAVDYDLIWDVVTADLPHSLFTSKGSRHLRKPPDEDRARGAAQGCPARGGAGEDRAENHPRQGTAHIDVERLEEQAGILKPKIDDWRAMVDCVMIDPAYNGEAFNVALSDIPQKKDDLVSGRYELPAPEGDTRVAVKIIDMLGEEVLIVQTARD